MSVESLVMRDFHPAENEGSPFCKSMYVVSYSAALHCYDQLDFETTDSTDATDIEGGKNIEDEDQISEI